MVKTVKSKCPLCSKVAYHENLNTTCYCNCWYVEALICPMGDKDTVCRCTNLSPDDRYLCYRRNIDILGPRCSCANKPGYSMDQMVDEDGQRIHTEDDNEYFGLYPDNNGVCNSCNRPRTTL